MVTALQLDRNTAAQEALHLPDPKGTPRQVAIDQATAALMPALVVDPVRNSRLVRIHVDMTDPTLAATIANAVAQAYIRSNLERHFDAASYATKFLEERLQKLKGRLEDSERDLVAYAQSAQLVSDKDGLALSGESLSDLNRALADAKNDRISAQAKLQQVQATGTSGIPTEMLDKSIVRALQARRAEIQAEYQDKLRIYKPDYPAMRQLKAQSDEVDRQVQRELGNIRASVRSEYEAARGREHLLEAQVELARSDALDIEKRGIQYNILKREVDTNRELYDGLLQRYKEVGVAGGVSTNNVSVVDTAQVPKQKFEPSLSRNLLLSLLFGSILGIAMAFLIEYLDDRVRGPEDVERLFGASVLGIIPKLRGTSPMEAAGDLRSAFAEAYRSLRTSLQFSTADGAPPTLLVTSASPGEGKTTTALLLARNFAELGKRVLLIDADLRNPTLHTVAQSPNGQGLTSFLAGVTSIGEVIQTTGIDNLWLIPAGPLPPNPAELLAGARLEQLLSGGARDYDQVIIDGPPVMGLADAPQIAHLAEGTIVMVASGKARRGAIRSALKRLDAVHAHVLGTVITMYDPRQSGAQDDYGAYSYYGYAARPDGK